LAVSDWAVTAGGTVGFDDLTTPAGTVRAVPGGSALYFTLAACRHCPVRPVAAIGADGAELASLLARPGVALEGVERMAGPTYRWRAVHGADSAVPLEEQQALGVYEGWRPRVRGAARRSRFLFLGSMPPQAQLELLSLLPSPELVALDTMRDFIATQRGLLLELATAVDLLFVDQAELAALTETDGPAVGAARSLVGCGRLRAVILKRGKQGVTLITATRELSFPAAEVERVVDPTGAGDALAGGLLGRMAQMKRTDEAALEEAMGAGLDCAAKAISGFGTSGLAITRRV
jgi:sugar/nucleoside kinase (ribokinase family)